MDNDKKHKKSSFARPVAQEKDRNTRAWLVFLALICFGVVLWKPAKAAWWHMRNRAIERAEAALPREADSFVAIAYEGVAKEREPSGRFITLAQFRDHLETLRDAGYHPISLADVRDFYVSGRKLPSKAVLVTFENNHKSTYFDSSDLLRSMRWHAVMGVVTKPVRDWADDVLLRPYLKDLDLDATWDLACESDSGTTFIPSDPHGNTAAFFSTPAWIASANRYESLSEFAARIEADHARALAEFTNHIGFAPIAFFFPNGNYGQFCDNNWALREANLDAVGRHYSLGFLLNRKALNTSHDDPRRLNRLEVSPDWSGARLLHELELAWPVLDDEFTAAKIDSSRWNADWGLLHLGDNDESISLLARPADDPRITDADATGGARAWITGSNLFFEGTFDTRFDLVRGELHIYLRFAADDRYLCLVITDTGRASFTRKLPGNQPEVLAETAIDTDSDFRSTHRLLITLRDGILFARLDNKPLFPVPIVLDASGVTDFRGLIGVGVWDRTPGLATVHLLETFLRPRIDGMAMWTPAIARDPDYISRALNDNAFRYAYLAPPWMEVHSEAPVIVPLPDRASTRIYADTNRILVHPAVVLHPNASFDSIPATRIVSQLREMGADGVFIDAEHLPPERLPELRAALVDLLSKLNAAHLGLSFRMPLALQTQLASSQTLAALPGAHMVDTDVDPPPGVASSRMITLLPLPPPPDAETDAISQISTAMENPADSEKDDDPATVLRRLRAQGLRAYADGDYAGAVHEWTQWTELAPDSAEAWAYLGNAYNRLRDNDNAIKAYRKSLDLEPGQIEVAIETAHLLEASDRDQESADLLDAYARAYPENRRIAVAQALWLDRHGHRSDGRAILLRLVKEDPADIPCRLTLQGLLDTPESRYGNMHELLAQVSGSGDAQLLGFGRNVASAELLTIPEASVFFDFIRTTATNSPRPSIRSLYSSFLPFREPVVEDFDIGRLSDHWASLGTSLSDIAGAYDLKAAADMAEAYLRLKNSELMRDGFIEVTLGESVGAFWLYARRSSRNMVRFGFDGDGFLRIQSWSDGEQRTVDSRAWVRPTGDIVIRLEIRGDGALGLINGKPVFPTPLPIPVDIAYGWWSVAPFSPELGIARARISRISAGPLRPTIALLRETDPGLAADALDLLRERSDDVSAVAPVLFVQHPDGTLSKDPIADLMPYRMFCSYHRLRLMPVVALDYFSDVRPEDLVKIILHNRLSGLVLQVRSMPSEKWFAKMTSLLENTSADLLVLQSDVSPWENEETIATLREIERGSLLLQPVNRVWEIPITPFANWDSEETKDSVTPTLLLLPKMEEKETDALPTP